MRKKKRKLAALLPPGPAKRHGGYSFMSTGRLPRHRRYILRYLTAARAGMIRDLGPNEEDLSTAQIILIDRAIGKIGLLRCIEEHVREHGVMAGDELAPALKASYLAYSNSLRLDLQALGLNRKALPEPTFADIIQKYDEAKDKPEGEEGK